MSSAARRVRTAALERVAGAGLPASTSGGLVEFPFESQLGDVFFAGRSCGFGLVDLQVRGGSAHVPFRVDAAQTRVTVEGAITHGVTLTFAIGAVHDAR